MRIKFWLILIVQAALVVLLAVAVKRKLMPLGVPGEWEWLRVPVFSHVAWDWCWRAYPWPGMRDSSPWDCGRSPRENRDGLRRPG